MLVTDTAGLRETEDAIEAEGVSRAHQAARDADIVLAVLDAAAPELDSALLTWTQSLQIEPETVSKAGGIPTVEIGLNTAHGREV